MINNNDNNNNNHNSSISLAELRVRPFDPTSKVAHERPGAELMDNRNDFLMFARQSHIAVYMEVVNELMFTSRRRGQRASVTVWLLDMTSGEELAAKTVALKFTACELRQPVRVDLPMARADVDSSHVYAVRVCDTASGAVLRQKLVRLYDLPSIRMIPTRWFRAVGASVRETAGREAEPLLTISGGGAWLELRLACTLDMDVPALPEVELRIIAPDGSATNAFCRVEREEIDPDGEVWLRHKIDSEAGGSGVWCVEARCMGYAFASALFGSGMRVAGEWGAQDLEPIADYTPEVGCARWESLTATMEQEPIPEPEHETVAGGESELDSLIGLAGVKAKLHEYTQLVWFSRMRERSGLPGLSMPLHAMFLGSPGTGKTTVAKIIGEQLREIGVLSKGHVVVRERASLIGQFYSSESENTLKALEEARGGILFIDEAYQLCQPDDPKDPGRFVIETLMTALADEADRDWMLILAGYAEPMQAMFAINPGLRSRIPASNIYTFDDFTEQELMAIASRYFARHRFELTGQARQRLEELLAHDYRHRDSEFGNARHVINLIQTAILPAMAMRVGAMEAPTAGDLSLIEATDIPTPKLVMPSARRRLGFAV